MSTLPNMPDAKQIAAMAPYALDPACVEAVESHEAMVKRLASARLKAKLSNLDPQDLVDGLRSVTVRKHGALLRAAFMESAEAFGDALMNVVVREMEIQSEIEAEQVAERIHGAEPKPVRAVRVFKIIGDMS